MTRQQLREDEQDYDPEDPDGELAQLEHYKLHGNAPRLMPDLSKVAVDIFSQTFFGGDSIFG